MIIPQEQQEGLIPVPISAYQEIAARCLHNSPMPWYDATKKGVIR